MRQIHYKTRYTTCIPIEYGGSGNPSIKTGEGIICAIQGAYHIIMIH